MRPSPKIRAFCKHAHIFSFSEFDLFDWSIQRNIAAHVAHEPYHPNKFFFGFCFYRSVYWYGEWGKKFCMKTFPLSLSIIVKRISIEAHSVVIRWFVKYLRPSHRCTTSFKSNKSNIVRKRKLFLALVVYSVFSTFFCCFYEFSADFVVVFVAIWCSIALLFIA